MFIDILVQVYNDNFVSITQRNKFGTFLYLTCSLTSSTTREYNQLQQAKVT